MRRLLLVTAVGLSLAGCDMFSAPSGGGNPTAATGSRPEPGVGAFAHSQSDDISGEYRVAGPGSGARLTRLHLGQTLDFEGWEGGRRGGGFAPVMLEIERADGGGERVLPETYSVSDGRVRMTGRSATLGVVSFDGRLDKNALATARRNLGDSEEATMTAVVSIGGVAHSGVKLHWYGGD